MQDILLQLGLSPDEARVYEYLLTKGATTAGDIIRHTEIKRGTAYNVLGDLAAKGFVRQINTEAVMKFALEHPSKIADLFEERKKKIEEAQKSAEAILPALTSRWNIAYHRPAVRYFEGLAGFKEILDDSLSAQETIYSYLDTETLVSNETFASINDSYVEKRVKKGVAKRIIETSGPVSEKYRSGGETPFTESRVLAPSDAASFHTVMQIYDNKVSYVTLANEKIIGVIIEDPHIYRMHRYIFNELWERMPMPRGATAGEIS